MKDCLTPLPLNIKGNGQIGAQCFFVGLCKKKAYHACMLYLDLKQIARLIPIVDLDPVYEELIIRIVLPQNFLHRSTAL